MDYEERYGEKIMSDLETEIEQKRIDDEERLRNLEIAVSDIKDLIKDSENLSKEDLKGEIEWILQSL